MGLVADRGGGVGLFSQQRAIEPGFVTERPSLRGVYPNPAILFQGCYISTSHKTGCPAQLQRVATRRSVNIQ